MGKVDMCRKKIKLDLKINFWWAGGNFQATRRHSLALALTGLKKRLNPSASASAPGDAARTNPTTPTDDKSLPTAFKRLSLKAFSPSER